MAPPPLSPRLRAGLLSTALLLAGPVVTHAQALRNGTGSLMSITDSVVYVRGTFENAGTLHTIAGRLFVDNGDFVSTGDLRPGLGRVRLDDPSAARVVTLSGDTLHRLQLNVPSHTTLGSDAVVKGALDLISGHLLTTAAFRLRLGPAAVINGETAAHYVRGSVVQQRAVSGVAPVSFGQMGVTLNPNGQNLTVEVDRRAGLSQLNYSFGQNPNFAGLQGIDRVWRLSTPGSVDPASPVTITLSWLSADDHGLTASLAQSQVWRSNDNGATWQAQNGVQNGSSRTVTITPTDLNAWYTVSTTSATLPVELVRFDAVARNTDALLTWATAAERNAARFVVERAADARTWVDAGQVAAAGTSTTPREYTFTDKGVGQRGTVFYYRLRQIDRDNSFVHSDARLVRFAAPTPLKVEAYPIPLQDWLTVDATAPADGALEVALYDATGRLVRRDKLTAVAGLNTWRVPVGTLPAGSYTLRATLNGGETVSYRLVK